MEINEKSLIVFNTLFGTQYRSSDIKKESIPQWDSMKHAELIIKLQQAFSIKFQVHEILQIQNFNELIDLIAKKTV